MPPPEESSRPDPETLLAKAKREEEAAGKGRFKIFFGAFPGAGKTGAEIAIFSNIGSFCVASGSAICGGGGATSEGAVGEGAAAGR